MNFYIVALLFLVLCTGSTYEILVGKKNRILHFFALCIFVFAISSRSVSTPDTDGYIDAYNIVSFDRMYYHDFSLMYITLTCIFKAIGFKVRTFFGFVALLNYGITYYSCKSIFEDYKKAGNVFFTYYGSADTEFRPCIFAGLYIPFFGLFYCGVAVRVSIAMSFVLISYIFCYRKSYLKYAASIIIAMLFHPSAILGLGLILCSKFTLNKQSRYIYVWVLIVVMWISHLGLIVIRFIPIIIHCLYEWTKISSFLIYELYYAASIRADAFWGKKELFFLFLGLIFITAKWETNRIHNKVLTAFFTGIMLGFAIEYLMVSYRIVDYFLMFFVPCGCIHFMKKSTIYTVGWQWTVMVSVIAMQLVIAMRIIGFA